MDKLEQENQELWKEKVAASAPHNLAEMMDRGINPEGEVRQFNPISMTYNQLWYCFAQNSVITPQRPEIGNLALVGTIQIPVVSFMME